MPCWCKEMCSPGKHTGNVMLDDCGQKTNILRGRLQVSEERECEELLQQGTVLEQWALAVQTRALDCTSCEDKLLFDASP
jgi:hypothetical protein